MPCWTALCPVPRPLRFDPHLQQLRQHSLFRTARPDQLRTAKLDLTFTGLDHGNMQLCQACVAAVILSLLGGTVSCATTGHPDRLQALATGGPLVQPNATVKATPGKQQSTASASASSALGRTSEAYHLHAGHIAMHNASLSQKEMSFNRNLQAGQGTD